MLCLVECGINDYGPRNFLRVTGNVGSKLVLSQPGLCYPIFLPFFFSLRNRPAFSISMLIDNYKEYGNTRLEVKLLSFCNSISMFLQPKSKIEFYIWNNLYFYALFR